MINLRNDVEMFLSTVPKRKNNDDWVEYLSYRNMLSHICGWDAGDNYEQEQYDFAVELMAIKLGF